MWGCHFQDFWIRRTLRWQAFQASTFCPMTLLVHTHQPLDLSRWRGALLTGFCLFPLWLLLLALNFYLGQVRLAGAVHFRRTINTSHLYPPRTMTFSLPSLLQDCPATPPAHLKTETPLQKIWLFWLRLQAVWTR